MRSVRLRRLVAVGSLVAVCTSACATTDAGTPSDTWSAQQVLTAISTWVNQTGLVQDDQATWRSRLSEMCDRGVWDEAVAVTLATGYVDEDETRYAGSDDALPDPRLASETLWMIAADTCPDRFPGGAPDERGW